MSARSLVSMIKLMVWYFVSDTHKDMFRLFWLARTNITVTFSAFENFFLELCRVDHVTEFVVESLKCWICLMTGREDKLFLAFGLSVSVGAGAEMG